MNTNFEEMLNALKEKRNNINKSQSFEEIAVLWKEIKQNHAECTKTIEFLSQSIAQLEKQEEFDTSELQNLKFADALNQIEKTAEDLKTAPISQLTSMIEKIQKLKMFCFKKLEEEKLKIEEVAND